eukprot:COSAG01_NODE_5370_length_4303_cov_1.671265_5_plen_132_part_00
MAHVQPEAPPKARAGSFDVAPRERLPRHARTARRAHPRTVTTPAAAAVNTAARRRRRRPLRLPPLLLPAHRARRRQRVGGAPPVGANLDLGPPRCHPLATPARPCPYHGGGGGGGIGIGIGVDVGVVVGRA